MTAGPAKPWRFGPVLALTLIVSAITWSLNHAGVLNRFAATGLDAFNILQKVRDPADVVLIAITDEDYTSKELFNATSPLACEVVKKVILAIAAGGPRVIGVDLDTSSHGFDCLKLDPSVPPLVVWVQDAEWDAVNRRFTPIPVLSGLPDAKRPQDRTGLGELPQEADGVIRRYHRKLPVVDGEAATTFPWAVIEAACSAKCTKCCDAVRESAGSLEEPLRLNFSGERFDFQPLSVHYVLQLANTEGWKESSPIRDKIVLLGGDYRAARDTHVTPVGTMNGVQILAQAIESDLNGLGIRTVNEVFAFVLETVLGLFLAWVLHRLDDRLTLVLVISLIAMPVLSIVGSYFAFKTFALWFNFVPVVVSVLIHQLYEHAREYQRLRAARA
jgi:CHASE2 domain-containing sensor protein